MSVALSERRHILVALLGRTPQILTETLYALCVSQHTAIAEMWAISTQEGQRLAVEKLLDRQHGQFYRLQKDYPAACGRVEFSENTILVAHDGLLPLADIHSRADSENFLELILRVLWEKTRDPKTAVHCSLAGGRKTMSAYMALVMQMLGREQDKLYHVLLTPPEAENHPAFYYPAPVSSSLRLVDGRTIDAAQVQVELMEIPYVRLREHLPAELFERQVSFAELLQWTQAQIAALPTTPVLQLFPQRHLLRIGHREVTLSPLEFCLYWHFAERSQKRSAEIPREAYDRYFERPDGARLPASSLKDVLEKYGRLNGPSGMRERLDASIKRDKGLSFERVLQLISRINNQKLKPALADLETAELYRISAVGTYGKCYGIKLDGRLIRVEE